MIRTRWTIAVLAAVVSVAALAAFPTAIPAGVPQTKPLRVISLVPAVTEMLFAIGAGSNVVGVSSFDRFPPEVLTRPKVGALIDPDFERILTLRPTLVVVYGSQSDLAGRLRRSSIDVFEYRHTGLSDITTTIRDLGNRVGKAPEAGQLVENIQRDLSKVRDAVRGRARPSTALVFSREPGALRAIYASGGIGFLHDLLVVAGGRNVFEDATSESLQASTELILARAPEVIIEIRPSEELTAAQLERERSLWRALPSVPAARSGRVHILTDSKLSIPGPRVAEIAQTFLQVLHPAAR